MRIERTMMAALCVFLTIPVMACTKKTEDSSSSSSSYSEKETTTKTIRVTEVNLGRALGSDKRIAQPITTFNPSDVIYASVVTAGTSPNTTIQVRWTYQDGQVIEETQQTIVATDNAATEFHISKPDGWPAGKYKAEVFLNGNLVETKEFEISSSG